MVIPEKTDSLKRVPNIGEELYFYDDGKCSESRQYKGIVCAVIPFEKANIEINPFTLDDWGPKGEYLGHHTDSIIQIWEQEKEDCDWLFAEETDYFIGFACHKYDDNILWFARTKNGGWFSMDIQSNWQGGRLDIDGEMTKQLEEEIENYKKWKAEHPESEKEEK